MTVKDHDRDPSSQPFAPEPSRVLELLERLGSGERLVDAPISMGLSQEQARVMFAIAAGIVRQSLATSQLAEQPSRPPFWKSLFRR